MKYCVLLLVLFAVGCSSTTPPAKPSTAPAPAPADPKAAPKPSAS